MVSEPVWFLSPLYLLFKLFKIPCVGPHSLKKNLGPHMRESVRIKVKWLNLSFPNRLNFVRIGNLKVYQGNINNCLKKSKSFYWHKCLEIPLKI